MATTTRTWNTTYDSVYDQYKQAAKSTTTTNLLNQLSRIRITHNSNPTATTTAAVVAIANELSRRGAL